MRWCGGAVVSVALSAVTNPALPSIRALPYAPPTLQPSPPMTAAAFDSSIAARMVRASKLEAALYEEVEHDQGATRQAAAVVILASIAAGVGALGHAGLAGLVVAPVFALIGWALYASITYLVGTRLLAGPDTSADWGEVARALGFAWSPQVLLVFAFLPLVGAIIVVAVTLWTFVTTIIAVRAALDLETGRAVLTALVGGVLNAAILGIVSALLG